MKKTLEQPAKDTPKSAAVEERRKADRYMMSASAIVSDSVSGARLSTRVGDISITGCYLDSINPFPEGTRLRLHISRDGAVFDGEGTVRYAKFGMGMGLAFLHLDDGKRGVLQGWIEKVSPSGALEEPLPDSRPLEGSGMASPPEVSKLNNYEGVVFRLIEKLQEKDLLSNDDVASVLRADVL